ncbi:Bug family tripartite tricarboxylate transporter substrate binding protein [Hydrogenophaga sp. BPS33]|uniref:Bug family tripartite tricarboxylate transporter substrate binding protein n=1 Tax=Hydrogenophaga sp. BPS33 TaxID=2651974 RepID=UPI00135B6E29|nr:tripartite tricarboxylate transporter substrate binding protein [Hydrogenophaga sp. BPS33]
MKLSTFFRRAVLLVCALGCTAAMAFPDKPIRIIVPFAAGGGTDVWARTFATRLSARLGQPVIVENRAGSNTQIGANAVAKADPDGYTLLFTSGTHVQVPALSLTVPYDVVRDFAPVGRLGTTGLVFVVHPSVKATNMKEFLAEAKGAEKWSLATYAAGSTGDVFSRALMQDHNLNIPVIAYKGEGVAITDVIGGQVQGGFFSIPTTKQLVASGKVKALGSLSTGQIPSMPAVQSLPDQGLTNYRWPGIWLGMFAPAKTPQPVLDKLSQAAQAITQDPEFQRDWASRDLNVGWRGPADFAQDIQGEIKTWGDLVKALGIKPQ